VIVRFLVAVVLAAILWPVTPVQGSDFAFSGMSTARQEITRLTAQSKDLVAVPFDPDNDAFWGTAGAVGATAAAYLFDHKIRESLNGSRSSSLDDATDAGSLIGNPILHLGIAGLVYGGGVLADSPRQREVGLMLGEAALLADASTFLLKQAVGRARPLTNQGRDSFRPFQFRSDYDSFPSMHTASSFAMASVLAGTSESMTVKVLSYSTAVFVGFSRMYEDKHWASDVVLGAAIGELCGRVVLNSRVHEGLRVAPVVSSDTLVLSLTGSW
jgi:hypothetical protein